jgi:hypothetical protein
MNRKLFTITLMALLALLLSVGGATGQGPEPEGEVQPPKVPLQDGQPQEDISAAATVNSRISYQGVLKESGTPVNNSRDMIFRLYSDSSCTTLEDTINKPGVTVTDGLFSVELDVDQGDFDGQGLWMQVEVGGTTVINCQEILPAPYALSLRPGAVVSGTVTGGSMLYAYNTATTGGSYGLRGRSDSTEGRGVYGLATAGGLATTYGVYGQSDSATGTGVYGLASSGGIFTNYGVYGQSNASGGYGGSLSTPAEAICWRPTIRLPPLSWSLGWLIMGASTPIMRSTADRITLVLAPGAPLGKAISKALPAWWTAPMRTLPR